MAAGIEQTVRGDEFDNYMGMGGSRPAPPQSHANASQPPAEAERGERQANRKNRKLLVMGGVGALALAGLGAFATLKPKDEPAAMPADIAAVIAAANGGSAATPPPQIAPPAPSLPAGAVPAEAAAAPVIDGAVVGAAPATPVAATVAATQPAATATPVAAVAAAPQALAAPAAPAAASAAPVQPAAQAAAPAPSAPVAPVAAVAAPAAAAASEEVDALRRQVAVLKTQRDVARSEAAAAKKRVGKSYTVVSVLADGVVVRDSAGHERVMAAGDVIGGAR